jgi:hypothetical protein
MDSALLFFISFLLNHITTSLKVQCSVLKVMLLTDAVQSQSSGYNWRWYWSVMMFEVGTWWWFWHYTNWECHNFRLRFALWDIVTYYVGRDKDSCMTVCMTVYMLVLCSYSLYDSMCSFLYDIMFILCAHSCMTVSSTWNGIWVIGFSGTWQSASNWI